MSDTDSLVTTLEHWTDVFMHRSMRNFIQFARESGLSMSQLSALFHLNSMGMSGVTDLGDHLGVTSAAASQMLDRLVKQGLIQRSEDPHDRRVKQIVLTDKGCLVLDEGTRARQSWLSDLADIIPDDEKGPIMAALNTLIDGANRIEKTADPGSK